MPQPTTPPPASPDDDLPALSYEQARDELVAVVSRLEAGGATLEESLTLWERGESLAARCQQWLDGARQRLSVARATDHVSAARAADHGDGAEPGDPAEPSTPSTPSTANEPRRA